jgi:ADP-ribose pyrophosphatase YjhB (NUDIX family)
MGSDLGYHKSSWSRGRTSSPLMLVIVSFTAGMIVAALLFGTNATTNCTSATSTAHNPASSTGPSDCVVSLGKYHGHEYRASSTLSTKCLVESKFLKLQQHQVAMPSAGKNSRTQIIDDWLFIDYHDRINVLVEAPHQPRWSEPHFYVFEQTKYALEDRMSWAVVGGIIEPNELPKDAARREVSEEMHVVCNDFHFLGRYRTDVNRGGGWTSTYLARHCEPGELNDQGLNEADEVGAPDTERQDLKTVSLTAVRKAVSEGKFLEIQWSATVALAVLHETLSR